MSPHELHVLQVHSGISSALDISVPIIRSSFCNLCHVSGNVTGRRKKTETRGELRGAKWLLSTPTGNPQSGPQQTERRQRWVFSDSVPSTG